MSMRQSKANAARAGRAAIALGAMAIGSATLGTAAAAPVDQAPLNHETADEALADQPRFNEAPTTAAAATPAPRAARPVEVIRPLRAGYVLRREDLLPNDQLTAEERSLIAALVGKEAVHGLYPGRPVTTADVAPAKIVDRNDIIQIEFEKGLLTLSVDGKALEAGAVGEAIRVMNLSSKTIIRGVVIDSGRIKTR